VSAHPRRTRRRAELSQHFLRKGATAARLVAATSISPRDLVLEIGAGRGALTRPQRPASAALRAELRARAEIVEGDFLEIELPRRSYKVVGSLPYARTTEIVRRLTSEGRPPDDAWLVVQREAARRFAGAPWGGETRWSLALKPWWHCELTAALRRVDFDPPPSVDSVLLWLGRRARPLVGPAQARLYLDLTDRLLRSGPTLARALRPRLTRAQLARLARDLGFDPAQPPSSLRFDQWLPVFRFLAGRRARLRGA
jgi:23S rRNA (adenine-N6)-dimethyltransferase